MNIDEILKALKARTIGPAEAQELIAANRNRASGEVNSANGSQTRNDLMTESNSHADAVTLSSQIQKNSTINSQAPATPKISEKALTETLVSTFAEALFMTPEEVKSEKPFIDMGLDSIVGVEWMRTLNQKFALDLPVTVLYDFPNIRLLTDYLLTEVNQGAANLEPAFPEKVNPEPAAQVQTPAPVPESAPVAAPVVTPQAKVESQSLPGQTPSNVISGGHSFEKHGLVISSVHTLDEVTLTPWEIGEPAADEVTIKVKASAINFPDAMCVNGLYPTMPAYPFVPGFEVAGIVTKVGAAVTDLAEGDEVIALTGERMGGHANFVNVPANNAIHKPANISFEQACSMPVAFGIVFFAFELGNLCKDEHVLIQTATGGCGLMAIQLAHLKGAICYGTSSKAEKLNILKRLNVPHTINYKTTDFDREIANITGNRGVDVVLNMLSGDAIQKGLNCLAPMGRYLEIAVHALKTSAKLDLSQLVHNQSIHSIDLRRLSFATGEGARASLKIMADLLASEAIVPIVSRVYPFSQLQEALQYVGRGEHIGKVVISHDCHEMTDYSEQCIAQMLQQQTKARALLSAGAQPYSYAAPAATVEPVVRQAATDTDIAVIGMAGSFPKSPDLTDFWRNLSAGENCVTEIPADRWSTQKYYDEDPQAPGKTNCKWMGALQDIDKFDSLFFAISPTEAEAMDPQQRLIMQTSWSCIENAGINPDDLSGTDCGVFIGVAPGDYGSGIDETTLSSYGLMGKSLSILSARTSFFLNLKGPCLTLDTACSASLVSVAEACNNLQLQTCSMALAGGVNVMTGPSLHIMTSKAEMLSPDGRCHTFDNQANGFVPGEGVGMLLLKKRVDAQRDGDAIHAVIKGWGVNQDGKTNGITAPSALSQTSLISSVYKEFNIDPRSITLFEAHGTGTKLGDPIEVRAMNNAFTQFTDEQRYCALGSVKSNIGHGLAAAGISGLMKVILAVKHKQLPPTTNFSQLNEHIDLKCSPFYINTTLQPWEVPAGQTRRGAVSSFGFSGTNAHMVVEQAPEIATAHHIQPAYMIVLSARSEALLKQQAERLKTHVVSQKDSPLGIDLGNISYTLMTGRKHFKHRLATVVTGITQLQTVLANWLDGGAPEQLFTGDGKGRDGKQQNILSKVGQQCIDFCSADFCSADFCGGPGDISQTEEFRQQLASVAELFVQGYELEYNKLFSSGRYVREELPTYPFAKKRFWYEVPTSDEATAELPKLAGLPKLAKPAQSASQPVSQTATPAKAATPAKPISPKAGGAKLQLMAPENINAIQPGSLERQSVKLVSVSDTAAVTKTTVTTVTSGTEAANSTQLLDYGRGVYCVEVIGEPANNPLSDGLLAQLQTNFAWITKQASAKAILLKGNQDFFLTGPAENVEQGALLNIVTLLGAVELPIIAVMQGASSGLGWWLASHCDLMVCSTDKAYGYKQQVSAAAQADALATRLFAQRFNQDFAEELVARGQQFTGAELLNKGLAVNAVSGPQVDSVALDLAYMLAAMPTPSLQHLKQHFDSPVKSLLGQPSGEAIPATLVSSEKGTSQQQWLQLAAQQGAVSSGVDAAFTNKVVSETVFSNVVNLKVFDGGIAQITLRDEANKNMLSAELVTGISEAFAAIATNPQCKVVIITGYDQYFSMGGTKDGLEAIQSGAFKFTDTQIYSIAMTCDIPVIAAIQGHGMGAGWSMGMYCDLAILSEDSIYISPYMGYGFTPGAGATLVFPYKVGNDLGRELLFTAREYKGSELKQRGIASPVLPGSEVVQHTQQIALQLSTLSREQLVSFKRNLNQYLQANIDDVYAQELKMHEVTFVGNPDVLQTIHKRFVDDLVVEGYAESGTASDGSVTASRENAQSDSQLLASIKDTLRTTLADQLGLEPDEIEDDLPFTDLGLDSVIGVTWVRKINQFFNLNIAVTKVYQYSNIEELAGLVLQEGKSAGGLDDVSTSNSGETVLDVSEAAAETPRAVEPPAMVPTAVVDVTSQPTFEGSVTAIPSETVSGQSDSELMQSISETLRTTLAEQLGLEPEEIEDDLPFTDLGLDSVIGVTWVRKINQFFNLNIAVTKVYQYSNIQELAGLILQEGKDNGSFGSHQANLATTQLEESVGAVKPAQVVKVDMTSDATVSEGAAPVAKPAIAEPVQVKVAEQPQQAQRVSQSKAGYQPKTISHTKEAVPQTTGQIAIVGMSGRMPQAGSVGEFWHNISQGKDCITEVPASRWPMEQYYDPNPQSRNKTYSKWMGAVVGVDEFDPLFFNISPQEAVAMDPQQRLFLEDCWHCVEDAGHDPSSLSGSLCGVFVGCGPNDYGYLQSDDLNAEGMTGSSSSILSGRISYFMNLQGPCVAIDTACSSSLVAISHACDSLLLGNCDMALAGGVCIMTGPSIHVMTSNAGMLSPTGRCYTFDQRADGFVPGEGSGVVMLKRLQDAIDDNNHIDAVVCGWGTNQDGKTNGITAPNPESQTRLETSIYNKFKIDPEDIQLLETHGTATKLGDPIEIEALVSSFGSYTKKQQYCALGSVKSNVGHLQAAAGVASLIKVVMAIKHQQLPPTINFNELNEHIQLDGSPFFVNTALKPWPANESGTRKGAISSFGFSGTNAHLVVGEHVMVPQNGTDSTNNEEQGGHFIIPLSAKTPEQLTRQAQNLLQYLTVNGADESSALPELQDIAYTLQLGRQAMKYRLAFVVSSVQVLTGKLQDYLDGVAVSHCYSGNTRSKLGASLIQEFGKPQDNIQHWIAQKLLEPMAQWWVVGGKFDWQQCYLNQPPQRLSLPGYPFAKGSYWPTPKASNEMAVPETAKIETTVATQPTETFSFVDDNWLLLEEQWQLQPLSEVTHNLRPQKVLVLYRDALDLQKFKQALKKQWGEQANKLLVNAVLLPDSAPEKDTVIARHLKQYPYVDAVFYFSAESVEPQTELHWVLLAAQALINNAPQQAAQFYYCYPTSDSVNDLYREGLSGLFRAVAMECPKHTYRSIELGQTAPQESAKSFDAIVQEWLHFDARLAYQEVVPGQLEMVRYRAGERYVTRLVEKSQQLDHIDLSGFRQGATYLVVGGLGEVGQLVCQELARQYRPKLVMLSRRPQDESINKQLAALQQAGAEVFYYSVDVTDRSALEQTFAAIRNDAGPLHGVLHLARQVQDGMIQSKTFDSFSQTIAAKVQGTLNIDALTASEPLEFFLSFSSMAAFGIEGSSDYGYATGFQNSFTRKRNELVAKGERAGQSLALCWGQWMVDSYSDPERDRLLERMGFAFIHETSALPLMRVGLQSGMDVMGVIAVRNKPQVKHMYGLDGDLSGLDLSALDLSAQQPLPKPPEAMQQQSIESLLKNGLSGHDDIDAIRQLLVDKPTHQLEAIYNKLTNNI